ncbi:MAG: hypothetical protein Pg6C_09440 [Treponemataceae bacterium]|nr:MAG: hypothetical protein Pg6C_09440 [Treponemataceae bacterium]
MTSVTGVIVQCRLSSARLPRKALLPILGAPVFSWTLRAMKKVNADAYIAAVDEDSFAELAPIAASEGFECVAGPRDDVLARFCIAIQTYKLDTVVRATADNPFLFYEAASESLALFETLKPDYLTFTSLPHGCGVEIFSAAALLKANGRADASAYEREHVGPALYNHAGEYDCRFVPPPPEYAHPEWNTSIDTADDYCRAKRLARTAARLFPRTVSGQHGEPFTETFSAREICAAYTDPAFARPVLLVPSVKKGGGTGHLRRMAELARALDADILIRADGEDTLAETGAILDEAAVIRTEDGGLRMQGTATSESLTSSLTHSSLPPTPYREMREARHH